MIQGVTYRRVSTREQERSGYSLEAQDDNNQVYAKVNDIEIVANFYDVQTGRVDTRAGLQQALEYLRSGKAKALVCIDNDRVFRNEIEYMLLRYEFQKAGIELHYSRRGGKVDLDSIGGQIVEDIKGRMAVEELRVFQQRSMESRYKLARTGKVVGHGRYPYGYRLVDQALVMFEPEAEIVRRVFEWYVYERLSARGIAAKLTEARIPTRADEEPDKYPRKKREVGEWVVPQ